MIDTPLFSADRRLAFRLPGTYVAHIHQVLAVDIINSVNVNAT